MTDGTLFAVALTRNGAGVLARLRKRLPEIRAFAPARYAGERTGVEGFDEPVASLLSGLWPDARGFLLVMAAGIAVRSIAPLLGDKASDPAVIVLDPEGRFAVPILSGHLGGANELARRVAAQLGATPVITTATDVAGRPAVEVWAKEHGFRWRNRRGVLRVNAAWASGDPVGLFFDPATAAGSAFASLAPHLALLTEDPGEARAFRGALVGVTHRAGGPLRPALTLRPPCLYLGVGCRKAADPGVVVRGIREVLRRWNLSPQAVVAVASVEDKAEEPALHALARFLDIPFRVYPASELAAVPVPTPSERVEQAVGTPSVSEAAALLASDGGRLLLAKVTARIWTLAVALRPVAGGGDG